jgi:hypothetical protein
MTMCPTCQLWAVKEGDNYCSLCGHKFSSLDLEIRPNRFLLYELAPPADLTIHNSSAQNDVLIQSIQSTVPWVSVDLHQAPLPLRLGPREKRSLKVEVDPLEVDEDYARAKVFVTSTAGPESVDLEVVPPPEVQISTGEYEIYLDKRDLEQPAARIEVTRGVVTVTSVTAEPSEWVTARPIGDVRLPLTLDARSDNVLDLRLVIDEEYLLTAGAPCPAEYRGMLRLRCVDFEREEPFVVRCWKPPEIWIWEESNPSVTAFVGKKGEVTLTVQNKIPADPSGGKGNAVLEIRSIAICNSDGTPNQWLRPADHLEPPFRIEGGGVRQLRFTFDAVATGDGSPTAAPPGRHFVVFKLETNASEKAREIRFEINVTRLPVFNGVLALDFGTSNTCCATLHRREDRFTLVPVDSPQHNPHPTTTPTIIQYCDLLPSGKKILEIGALVEARYSDPRVVGSTVRSPKRYLGRATEEGTFEIRFFYNVEKQAVYRAREVVADYLTRVRLVAEERRRAQFKRIIITYPARFRMNQLRDLEAAVFEAFGRDCEISALQEPVAAALNFIVSEEALASAGYTLGVFDFGGGTTDLSLLRVDNIRIDSFTEIRARLISSAGKWFGGEDITRFVMDFGLKRCQALARQLRGQVEIFTDSRQTPDWNRSWLARLNQSRLLRWAETTKLLLVEHGDDHEVHLPALPDIFPAIKLSAFATSGSVEEMVFPHSEIVPRQAEVYAYLESEIVTLARSLAGLMSRSESKTLDYILLSGKSSAIRLVGEVLGREFPNSTIRMASEPKECVVAGACILEKFQQASDKILNIEGIAATTSRIGIEDVGPGGAKMFREFVAAGVPIPEDGLMISRPILFHRRREIRLLENAGDDDALWIMGKENPNIDELGLYGLEQIPDWLPQSRPVPATLELHVDRNLECALTARIESRDEVLRFVLKAADSKGDGDGQRSASVA